MVKSNKSTDSVKGGIDMVENTKSESEEKGATISFKKSTLWKVGTFVFLGLFIISLFTGGLGGILNNSGTTGNVVNNGGNDVGNTPQGSESIKIPTIGASDAVLGDKNAPITVFKFSDLSCPFCAAASGDNPEYVAYMKQRDATWEPIVTNLITDYVNKGKVKLVVKYSMGHSGGRPAQLTAWCLNEQGLYWKFYPKAFANIADVEDLAKMKTLAKGISGVDNSKLESCLASNKYDSRFASEQNEGVAAGMQGTPYFLIVNSKGENKQISGAVSYSSFEASLKSLQ